MADSFFQATRVHIAPAYKCREGLGHIYRDSGLSGEELRYFFACCAATRGQHRVEAAREEINSFCNVSAPLFGLCLCSSPPRAPPALPLGLGKGKAKAQRGVTAERGRGGAGLGAAGARPVPSPGRRRRPPPEPAPTGAFPPAPRQRERVKMPEIKERSYFAEFPVILQIDLQICRNLPREGAAGEAGGLSAQPVSQGAAKAGTSSRSVHGLVAHQDFGLRHQTLTNAFWETRARPHGPSRIVSVCGDGTGPSAPSCRRSHMLERMQYICIPEHGGFPPWTFVISWLHGPLLVRG
ncbi:uncharacterized protein WM294_008807 [Sarcoramphus papa]